ENGLHGMVWRVWILRGGRLYGRPQTIWRAAIRIGAGVDGASPGDEFPVAGEFPTRQGRAAVVPCRRAGSGDGAAVAGEAGGGGGLSSGRCHCEIPAEVKIPIEFKIPTQAKGGLEWGTVTPAKDPD